MTPLPPWRRLWPHARPPLHDPERRARAVGVWLAGLSACGLVGVMGLAEVLMGGRFGYALLAMVGWLALLLALFRRMGRVRLFAQLVVGSIVLGMVVLMAATGGRATGAAMMLPFFLLLGALVLRRRQVLAWAVVAVGGILVSYAMARMGAPALLEPQPAWAASAAYRVPVALCVLAVVAGTVFMRGYRGMLEGLMRSRRRQARLRQRAQHERRRFADFAQVAADWFWETDADDRFIQVSAGFGRVLGLDDAALIGITPLELARRVLTPEECARIANPLASRQDFHGQRLRAIDPDGRRRILRNAGKALFDAEGAFAGYRGAAVDITDLDALTREMRRMAETDALTGLANRRFFAQALEKALGRDAWLLVMDLDGFKRINDTHGHEAGDAALRAVATALRGCARDTDVVARLGGDEFAVLLPHPKQAAGEHVGARVLAEVHAIADADPRFAGMGVSLGLARLDQAHSVDEALSIADRACYAAKRAGRDQLHTATPAHAR